VIGHKLVLEVLVVVFVATVAEIGVVVDAKDSCHVLTVFTTTFELIFILFVVFNFYSASDNMKKLNSFIRVHFINMFVSSSPARFVNFVDGIVPLRWRQQPFLSHARISRFIIIRLPT
jgi:hypothetical protein